MISQTEASITVNTELATIMKIIAKALSSSDDMHRSPYPTVVMVVMAQ